MHIFRLEIGIGAAIGFHVIIALADQNIVSFIQPSVRNIFRINSAQFPVISSSTTREVL